MSNLTTINVNFKIKVPEDKLTAVAKYLDGPIHEIMMNTTLACKKHSCDNYPDVDMTEPEYEKAVDLHDRISNEEITARLNNRQAVEADRFRKRDELRDAFCQKWYGISGPEFGRLTWEEKRSLECNKLLGRVWNEFKLIPWQEQEEIKKNANVYWTPQGWEKKDGDLSTQTGTGTS